MEQGERRAMNYVDGDYNGPTIVFGKDGNITIQHYENNELKAEVDYKTIFKFNWSNEGVYKIKYRTQELFNFDSRQIE